ncbi:PspC domain-containing protein [Xylocopilactobacillus apicola]|uniref:Phage shock protein PspC N-terminal domain-containing protein n=1 Tax=Xylocopilactobacillus apicola TaxID=2932184 RepID=A0AAU9CZQ8_9LACO|nr:PspC domain-containing protein [Xylocopilactobacillus apicola]BDR59474.1 hypothetical protein XA3_19150 [Xylocopilactobacillus apicola]
MILFFIFFFIVISLLILLFIASLVGRVLGLYKSTDNRVLAGVCGGIGERFGISPGILRIVWLLSILLLGQGLFWYLAFAIVLPTKSHHWDDF